MNISRFILFTLSTICFIHSISENSFYDDDSIETTSCKLLNDKRNSILRCYFFSLNIFAHFRKGDAKSVGRST